jgi:uncharacterized protein
MFGRPESRRRVVTLLHLDSEVPNVRVLAILLALLILVGSPTILPPALPAAAQAIDEEGDTLDAFVDELVAASNAFWREIVQSRGKTWRDPKIVRARSDERVRSKCGNSTGASHSYCPADETIFFDWDGGDEDSFEALWDDERYFVIVTTVGHEYAHHVQELLGIFENDTSETSVKVELQADCLMGVFANVYRKSTDWVTRDDLKDAIEDTHEAGDDEDSPPSAMTHGTPEQRVEAYLRGFQANNVAACGI